MHNHWGYTKYNGLSTDADYPYTGASKGSCQQKSKTKVGFVEEWKPVSKGVAKQKALEGPMSIAMSASEPAFMYYKSGVIQAS